MTTLTDAKEIKYNRLDRDYSAYFDGEFIGAYPNYHAAELALDDHALYLIEQGLDRTATELDGGCDDGQPGGSGGGDGLMQMPEGDWLDTNGMRVAPPTAQRILVFCEVCGAPGTTTDPDTDYLCSDCLASTASTGAPETVTAALTAAP